ncbi:alpha/beta hydrolase [Candidatus Harpocratesius sp.]
MQSKTFTYTDYAGIEIFVYKWIPEESIKPRAVVQILHGMAEHAARYQHVAEALTKHGFIVYADDHRGHGKSALGLEHAGELGPDGWEGTLKSIRELTDYLKAEYPDLPVFLLGHSWGSYLAQDYIQQWGSELKGVVLSGTNGAQPMLNLLLIIGTIIAKFKGYNAKGKFIDKLAIKPLNKPFEPADSQNCWLSRDPEVVKKYDEDPWCGFMVPYSYFIELAKGLKKIWKPNNEEKIPKDLPIYLFSGGEDPTNMQAKGFKSLVDRYEKLGIRDLSYKIYDGARHETLNETNKEEVIQDLINWLESKL